VSEVLLLNFSYESLNVVSLQRAVRLLFARKAETVACGDRTIGSVTYEIRLPSVIRMLYYIKRPRSRVALSKRNVILRDDSTCQYCGIRGRDMTIDHVVPRSRGGASTWENLASACGPCNSRKRNRTPNEANMRLHRKPYEPRFIPWLRIKRNTLPSEWGKYLFLWDVSIEERVG
jgi:5-methylcytosine-specific restriction endonuclease McrA